LAKQKITANLSECVSSHFPLMLRMQLQYPDVAADEKRSLSRQNQYNCIVTTSKLSWKQKQWNIHVPAWLLKMKKRL